MIDPQLGPPPWSSFQKGWSTDGARFVETHSVPLLPIIISGGDAQLLARRLQGLRPHRGEGISLSITYIYIYIYMIIYMYIYIYIYLNNVYLCAVIISLGISQLLLRLESYQWAFHAIARLLHHCFIVSYMSGIIR